MPVDKARATKLLKEFLMIEELIIPLYSKHVDNSLFLSGIKKDNLSKVQGILDALRTDSMRHKQILEGLISSVERSGKDVY
jgi:hypothetical protein